MSSTDFSTDLTALLARHERATHVIAIDADAQIDPRHIKMLCVATGVDAFPLSSEQVAVHCPSGVPQALSDLPVQIGGLAAPASETDQTEETAEPASPDPDGSDAPPEASPESEMAAEPEPPADAATEPAAATPTADTEGLEAISERLDAIQQALADPDTR